MVDSTSARSRRKPEPDDWKPWPGFPLSRRKGENRFCKRVHGKLHYFTGTAEQAEAEWNRVKDDLYAGRKPRPVGDGLTLKGLGNRFLEAKQAALQAGELAPRTFARYKSSTDFLIATFGENRLVDDLRPDDFRELRTRMAARWGAISLANEIQMVRTALKFAFDEGLITAPIRYGQAFDKPSAKAIRQARLENGPKLFTGAQIKAALAKAKPAMRAMILLGINAGLGNTDLAMLTIDRATAGEWLDYPRVKTAMPRRVPLWKETQKAIAEALAKRKAPADPADEALLFIGSRGENYVGNHKGYRVCQEFAGVLAAAGVKGRSFYDLRRTFQTIAEGAHDLTAVQAIMGHAPKAGDMSAIYRQGIDDSRLEAVTEHVRQWLFPRTRKGVTK